MTDIERAFLDNHEQLMRLPVARGAGDAAEDLLQELWLKIKRNPPDEVHSPRSYLMRAANHLMIDRHRSHRKAADRDRAWFDHAAGDASSAVQAATQDRAMAARQQLAIIQIELDKLGKRPALIFHRHRIDGVPQRVIAEELEVSLSTVESDLRKCYLALAAVKERFDEV